VAVGHQIDRQKQIPSCLSRGTTYRSPDELLREDDMLGVMHEKSGKHLILCRDFLIDTPDD
jgi:hypothetical protein